jgi:hypothetical protein
MLKVAGGGGGVSGALVYQGTWDALTNNPTLTSGVGTKGYYYVVSIAGTTNLDGITDWQVGDWAVFNGTVWQKVDNSEITYVSNVATGTGLTGGPITSTGTISIANTAVTAASYGAADTVGTFTVNAQGQLTAAANAAIAINVGAVSGAVPNTVNVLAGTGLSGGGALTANVTLSNAGVLSFNTRVGDVTLSNTDVTTALGYTPGTGNGTVTSVTGTTPISSSGGATPNISISLANTTTDGYLSSTDWNTFNGKQTAYTNLSTIGGLANSAGWLYNNGTGTFSYSTPTASDVGAVPTTRTLSINGTSYDLTANRTWSVGTVTSVAALTLGTTGTDLSSTVADSTTTPVITLNVPTASATNRGVLSSADWTTFNNKGTGNGSVTSVDVLGGTTGLTTSGGPITTSGNITIAGTLNVSSGGTGVTSLTSNAVIIGNATGAVTTVSPGAFNNALISDGTNWVSSALPASGVTITDDTSSNVTRYVTLTGNSSGTITTINVSSTKLTFNPSTGTLTSTVLSASNGLLINNMTVSASYTIPSSYSAMSTGPITLSSGVAVTVPSGSRWVVL